MSPFQAHQCPLCQASECITLQDGCLHKTLTYTVLQCSQCGSLFHDLAPSESIHYTPDYHAYAPFRWCSPKTVLLAKKTIITRLLSHIACGTILDVGCGAGHVLRVCKLLGLTPVGFDLPSPATTNLRKESFTIYTDWHECHQYLESHCDLVICWHTLEHVPKPLLLIDDLVAMLKTGGILSLEVPDPELILKYCKRHPSQSLCHTACFPEHLLLPSRTEIIAQLEKRGLNIRRIYYPKDGAFYSLYDRMIKTSHNQDNPDTQASRPAPSSLAQLFGFMASCVLEPLSPLLCDPLAYHIIAEKT